VWVGSGVKKFLKEEDFPPNFHFTYFNFGTTTIQNTFRINRVLQKKEQQINPDIIIATSGPTYFHSKAPQIIGNKQYILLACGGAKLGTPKGNQYVAFALKGK
jgi:hypothetical protein